MDKIITINEVKREIEELRGQTVRIFGQPTKLPSEVEDVEIDVLDVLEDLKFYEIEPIIYEYDSELDEYVEAIENDVWQYLDKVDELDGIKEVRHDNSYNWNSPISNDIDYIMYENLSTGQYLVLLKVHRYGDVRVNYTDYTLLKFDEEYEFYEVISNCNRHVNITVDDNEYSVYINILSEELSVYNMDTGNEFYVYGYYDMEGLRDEIRRYEDE